MAFGIERRALHRMRAAERNAAFRDARNLEDEYSDPTAWRAPPSDVPRTQPAGGGESPTSRLLLVSPGHWRRLVGREMVEGLHN